MRYLIWLIMLVLLVSAVSASQVLYLSMDLNNATGVHDNSGNGNDGTVSGATWTASGKNGGAYRFDDNKQINISHSSSISFNQSSFSICLWARKEGSQTEIYGNLFDKASASGNRNYNIYWANTGHISLRIRNSTGDIITSNPTSYDSLYNDNSTFRFICGVYSLTDNNISLYIDGGLSASRIVVGSITNNSAGLKIGRLGYDAATNYHFNGTIDEVKIWNTSLSAAEILAEYNSYIDVTIESPQNTTYLTNHLPMNISLNYTTTGTVDTCLLNPTITNPSTWCYQETANVSTACGGLNTGKYDYLQVDDYGMGYRIIDGNWGTDGFTNGDVSFYVNYTRPGSLINANWQVNLRDGSGANYYNISLNSLCLNSSVQLRLRHNTTPSPDEVIGECYYGGTWNNLFTHQQSWTPIDIYEEAMWWNITPQNYSTIASGGTNLNCSNSNIVISASGNYFDTVWVNLTDGTSDYANVSYYVSYYATPPSIAITSPYNAQFLYNASDSITYPARFTITTPYLDECWYTYNSTVVYSCANFTMTLNGYNNYSLTVWANDTYGNVANANSTFTLANFTINSLFALFYNEENGLQLTDNFTLQVIGPRYSVNFSGGYNYSLQNLLTDIYNFRYSSANYVTRNFYVNISQGSTQTIKLYTLNSSKAQLVQFTITDTAGMPYVGATVSVYRFIIPTNSWEVIEMARSDQNGQGMLNLFPYSVNYKYSITDSDGQPIFYSSVPTVISSSSIYFNIPVINTMLPYWNLQNNLVHTLDFTNATSIFTFTWSDPSNSVVFGNLSIYRNNPQESVLVCSSKAYGTSGTVSCDLSVHDTTSTYHAVSYVMANGTLYQVDIYDKVFSSSASMWGISGAFLAMLIILILACMGLWNPSAALVFAGIGVLISSYFQLIPLSYMWIAGLLALIAIAIWRMRA